MRWVIELLFGRKIDFRVIYPDNTDTLVRAFDFYDALVKVTSIIHKEPIMIEPMPYENIFSNIKFSRGHNQKKIQVTVNRVVYEEDTSLALQNIDNKDYKASIINLAWIKKDIIQNRNNLIKD